MLTEREVQDLSSDCVTNLVHIFCDHKSGRGPIPIAEAAVVSVIKKALDAVPQVPESVLGLLRGAQADLDNGDHTSVDQDNALAEAIRILEKLPIEAPKKTYTVVMFIREVSKHPTTNHQRVEYVEAVSPAAAKERAITQARFSHSGIFDIDVLFVAEGHIENLK